MKLLISTLLVLAPLSFASPTFAVDKSISALCDGSDTGYNRPGGFCDQVASNKSLAGTHGAQCSYGYVLNGAPPPKCVPAV